MMALAAKGSVGETIAPSAKAAAHGNPSTAVCAITATTAVVAATRPTAFSEMARTFSRRSRSDE